MTAVPSPYTPPRCLVGATVETPVGRGEVVAVFADDRRVKIVKGGIESRAWWDVDQIVEVKP